MARTPVVESHGSIRGVSIRKRGKQAYQVRIAPFPAQTVPTLAAAEKLELDLKTRRSLGDMYEAPPITVLVRQSTEPSPESR
jgi:hypothetical protein